MKSYFQSFMIGRKLGKLETRALPSGNVRLALWVDGHLVATSIYTPSSGGMMDEGCKRAMERMQKAIDRELAYVFVVPISVAFTGGVTPDANSK